METTLSNIRYLSIKSSFVNTHTLINIFIDDVFTVTNYVDL